MATNLHPSQKRRFLKGNQKKLAILSHDNQINDPEVGK